MNRLRFDHHFSLTVAVSFLLHVAAAAVLLAASSGPLSLSKNGEGDGIIHVSLVSVTAASGSESAVGKRQSVREADAKDVTDSRKKISSKEQDEVRDNTIRDRASALAENAQTDRLRSSSLSGGDGTSLVESTCSTIVSTISGSLLKEAGEGAGQGLATVTVAVPRYRENDRPAYPAIARSRGYEGMVILAAKVLTDGKVGDLKIARTSGYAMLDQSALNAVRLWKFDPAKKMGRPVTLWVEIPVRFSLSDSSSL